jgi:NAD+ kinase
LSAPRAVSSGKHDDPTAPTAGSVKSLLVLADCTKEHVRELLPAITSWLDGRVDAVHVEEDIVGFSRARAKDSSYPVPGGHPDLVVVLGGDGSILSAARAFKDDPVPTLGINLGRVGFLATVEVHEWQVGIADVLEGRALVEPRMRFDARIQRRRDDGSGPKSLVALNDLVLTRGALQGMVEVSLRVGDSWVSDYRGDGLILATPNGSTAHSLAAGGPILAPSMRGVVVTPICPHALSHRPLVLHSESEIAVEVVSASGLVSLAVDGHGFFPLDVGDAVIVRQHPVAYPLLARPGSHPWQRLRDRLGWRGSFTADSDIEVTRSAGESPGAGQGEVL